MNGRPPDPGRGRGGIAALAAAATPVVAAALVTVALVAIGCRARPPAPAPSAPPTPGTPSVPATPAGPASGRPADADASPDRAAARLLVAVGAPARPRGTIHDLAAPDAPVRVVELPRLDGGAGLAAIASAADGRLAAIGRDGRVWLASPIPRGDLSPARWVPLPALPPEPGLPGPVVGGTWSDDGSAVVLVAGAPGSGVRRTAIVTVPVDGSPPTGIEVPLEADGPGVAALPGGVVAFVGRDLRDRGALVRTTPSGSFATLPIGARGVVAGGGLVAIVGDADVHVGTLEDLGHGVVPAAPLPLEGPGGIGAVAIAGDGTQIAVVRLDEEGAAATVEIVRRTAGGWAQSTTLPLDPHDGTATVAWLP